MKSHNFIENHGIFEWYKALALNFNANVTSNYREKLANDFY